MHYSNEVAIAIGELLPLFRPFAQSDRFTSEQSFILGQISGACLRATDATLILLEQERIWESEITLRTVTEGTVKMLFLLSSPDLFADKYSEFTETLPDIAELRSHERAKELLASLSKGAAADLEFHQKLIISAEREKELRDRYPRLLRQQIEQRWSFSEMINAISKSSLVASDLFKSLLYGYWTSSQVAHVSFEGIMMPTERESREPRQKLAVNLAHSARVASDCYIYCIMRLHTAIKFVGADLSDFRSAIEAHKSRLQGLQNLYLAWRDTELAENFS
ncbi:MAG TPA: DUF5677 domain-containing protein [Acidobacteriaceae bacterium]|nr:DUF5677 domain-containing protein [Acidobacteriaceae bacterium]